MKHRFAPMSVKALAMAAVVAATSTVPMLSGAAHAAPVISAGGPFAYAEQDPPVNIGVGTVIGGDDYYDGSYVDIEITDATSSEFLGLEGVTAPSIVDGEVSVVGTAVYLGDGTSAVPIGSLDAALDGREGRTLRINFGSDFRNGGFETGSVEPWTSIADRVELGVTEIAGFVALDTAEYPADSGGDDHVPATFSYTVGPTDDAAVAPTEGDFALELRSQMWMTRSCAVVHGPAAYSAPFDAAAGQELSFDWRAFAGWDAYHVFGYLLNTTTGAQTEVLDAYTTDVSGTTDWATVSVNVPTSDTYRFVFVSGTYDGTCGLAGGAALYLDNFQVVSASLVDDDVVTKVVELLTYENTSDDPASVRNVNVTAEDVLGATDSATIVVDITAANDVATADPMSVSWLNNPGDETFADISGSLGFTDPDSSSLTYGIEGGVPGAYPVGGETYDVALTGVYGSLYVDSVTGDYRFVAADAAVEEVAVPVAETFTVTADDGEDIGSTLVTLGVNVPPAPRNVVGAAGDGQIVVDWDQPIDPAGVIGYVATASPGGATCTTADVAATTCTIEGLTNGTEYTIVVTPITAGGLSTDSLASDPVTPVGPPTAPTSVTGTPGAGRVLVEWDVPINDGGSDITGYTVTSAPGGATCSTDGATNCTVLGLALGTEYTFTVTATNALGESVASTPVVVTVRNPSTTALAVSDDRIDQGDDVTLTATVSGVSPTGSVEFFAGAVSLGSATVVAGVAAITVDSLGIGSNAITAVYSGDADDNPSSSAAEVVEVRTAASVTVEPIDAAVVGDSITIVADVAGATPTGSVEFFAGAVSLGTAAVVDGVAELEIDPLAVGGHTIEAVYSGDDSNSGASNTAALRVLDDTTVELTLSDEHISMGQTVTLTAVVSGTAPTGTVDFFVGATRLGTAVVIDGVAELVVVDLEAGSHEFRAEYAGDANNVAAASAKADVAVDAADLDVRVADDGGNGGAVVDVIAIGLLPGSEVAITFDDGESLGRMIVGEDGLTGGTAPLPEDLPAGDYEVTVTGVGGDGTVITESMTIVVDPEDIAGGDLVGGYVGVSPTRVLDTRSVAKLGARDVVEFTVPDALVTDDVTAVVLNLAVTEPEARGYLTVYPCASERPLAATLNYGPDSTISNLAIAGFRSGDALCVFSLSPAHVVADLNGFYREDAPDRFAKLDQTRLFDSREGGERLADGEIVEIAVVGPGLAPAGTEAVNLYVASDQPMYRGFLTVFPCGDDRPLAANLNYAAHQTIGNNVIAKVSEEGTICVFARSTTHVVVDLHGIMHDTGESQMTSQMPGRHVDTRESGKIGARQELVVDFSDAVPVGTVAVELNVAATEAESRGHFRVYPCGGELPLVASLNYPAGGSASGHVTATLSDEGTICIFTLATTHIVVDVQGTQVAD